ncbi:cupin domain-containing protein [Candidatus Pelagibacter sp.]|nr:cupin domain-containing protein [Candidatus Pelagibacter sp.]
MINRLAKFNDLIPSSLPFVEGRLEGHRERKNYTIIGRGVAEDSRQSVKIQSLHGYNLGAVSAMPKNGSGLHSHTTAEVFIIYSGKWRFYWGADGKNETILNKGDIISMPTNMFRAFENYGDEESLMFVVLGGDDPGIITWVPEILNRAKETGMALLDDNSLIDLRKNEIPNGRKIIEPISLSELDKFDNYLPTELEKNIFRNEQNNTPHDQINNIDIFQVLGKTFNTKKYNPLINQDTGFNLTILKSRVGKIENIECSKPTTLFAQHGLWEIKLNDINIKLEKGDTFSVPINNKISILCNNSEDSTLNFVSQI